MEVDYQRELEITLSKLSLAWQREVEIPIAYEGKVFAQWTIPAVPAGEFQRQAITYPTVCVNAQIILFNMDNCM